jgi:hypothetical protein
VSGATNVSLTLANIQCNQGGNYCQVRGIEYIWLANVRRYRA